MKLSKWAKLQGVHYGTALRWFHQGKISGARQLDTGTVLVDASTETISQNKDTKAFIYCRVSTNERKDTLVGQEERCRQFCAASGIVVQKTFKEVASGMNDNRQQLMKMLAENPTMIVVENKDRLTRFGFNYLKILLEKLGCRIIVLNESGSDKEDLLRDLTSIMTSFCGRIYGLRRAKNKLVNIKKEIEG